MAPTGALEKNIVADLARLLREAMLRDLANAHGHTLLLGRMTASERVASFLLEMFERRDQTKALDVPMPRRCGRQQRFIEPRILLSEVSSVCIHISIIQGFLKYE